MAGNVTGSIGADNVNLNNAATESTLAALLKIAQVDSKNLIEIAKKAFPDIQLKDFEQQILKGTSAKKQETQATVQNTNAIEREQERRNSNVNIINQLNESMTKLMDGTFQVSDVFGALKNAGPIIGTIAAGFERLASIQQQNFEAYQKVTDVGVNFGGSLTQLRQAAADSYLTLGQFGDIVKNNGQTLARMGGSANEGAIAFSKASKALMGEFGSGLMAMGYTTQDVNQGMIDYIAITGGRTREEMKDQKALAAGTKGYLEELDRLADITGRSREEIAKEMKSKAEAADMQLFMASMSKEEAEKFQQVYNDARTKYGQGAADNVLAAAQGRAVTTDAGKKYAALAPMATESLKQQLAATQKYGKDSQQARDAENAARVNNSKEFSRYSGVLGSATDVLKGNEQAAIQSAKDRRAGMDNLSALEKAEIDRKQKQAEVEKSQAATMAKTNEAFAKLGAALWSAFSPFIELLTPVIGVIGKLAGGLADLMTAWPKVTSTLVGLATVAAMITVWKAKEFALDKAKSIGGGLMSGAGKIAGGGAGVGSSPLDAVGKAGGGVGGALEGLAKGLTAFANPMILLGATILAGSLAILITGVGAGIAATMALIGLSLPVFSEGLKKLSEVDSSNFGSLALGMGALGLGLLSFGPFAIFGIPAGIALNSLADGVVKLNSVDPVKLEQVANALQKVKDATPTAGEIIRIGMAAIATKVLPSSDKTEASPGANTTTASSDTGNNVATELKHLNSMTQEMIKLMRENVEYSKRNVSATKAIGGDQFKF